MSEIALYQDGKSMDWTPAAALSAGDCVQFSDGRAAVATTDIAAGVQGSVQVCGIGNVTKTASQVWLKGTPVYWDSSANAATLVRGTNTADFFLGTVVEAATSAATTGKVNLNVRPQYTLALEDGFSSIPIVAVTANPQGHMFAVGNGVNAVFDTAAEAQKWDALSIRDIATGTKGTLNAMVCVNTNGDDAAFDLNIGLADGTHATSADSITASLFCHIDGASTNINVESDDDTTEVAATDSTVDFTAGTPFLFQVDLTDWSDPQVYIDGVNVLSGSTFDISAATGPMKLLFHMEKTANDSPGNVSVLDLGFVGFDT